MRWGCSLPQGASVSDGAVRWQRPTLQDPGRSECQGPASGSRNKRSSFLLSRVPGFRSCPAVPAAWRGGRIAVHHTRSWPGPARDPHWPNHVVPSQTNSHLAPSLFHPAKGSEGQSVMASHERACCSDGSLGRLSAWSRSRSASGGCWEPRPALPRAGWGVGNGLPSWLRGERATSALQMQSELLASSAHRSSGGRGPGLQQGSGRVSLLWALGLETIWELDLQGPGQHGH